MSQLNRSYASLGLLCVLSGCQPLDTNASLGNPFTGAAHQSAALDTSSIETEDGQRASSGCEAVRLQAYQILDRTCAQCHGGGAPGARQGTPPFESVLDEERMLSLSSATAKDPDTLAPARFLVPGDPDHSRIYLRPLHGEMPPPDIIGLPANPRPSVSDLSVLRHWIARCIPAADAGANLDPDDHGDHGGDDDHGDDGDHGDHGDIDDHDDRGDTNDNDTQVMTHGA